MGIRLSVEEFLPDGINPDMAIEIVDRLIDEVPVDFIHVTHSAYIMSYSLGTQMADMTFDEAPLRKFSATIKRALQNRGSSVPVITVCKYRDLAEAEKVLAAGDADLVGMARAHIADPAIVRKSLEGRQSEVRTCIGCNQGCAQHLEHAISPSRVWSTRLLVERLNGQSPNSIEQKRSIQSSWSVEDPQAPRLPMSRRHAVTR